MSTAHPLVSIMMPVYNAALTLPMALASVFSQTYEHWELIIVNDGSTDGTGDILHLIDDPRVKVTTLESNQGRGAARQMILEQVVGSYLCFLDSDDWMYPNRIERQVQVLEDNPDIAMVSSGAALVDKNMAIKGVRRQGGTATTGGLKDLSIPFIFAATMIRVSDIDGVSFDQNMRFAEDTDFIVRILIGKQYTVTSKVLYAYTELESVTASKSAKSTRYFRKHLWKHSKTMPKAFVKAVTLSYIKELCYWGATLLPLDNFIVSRRSRLPSLDESRDHISALRDVLAILERQESGVMP